MTSSRCVKRPIPGLDPNARWEVAAALRASCACGHQMCASATVLAGQTFFALLRSDYGSEGWGFESLRARKRVGRRARTKPGLFASASDTQHFSGSPVGDVGGHVGALPCGRAQATGPRPRRPSRDEGPRSGARCRRGHAPDGQTSALLTLALLTVALAGCSSPAPTPSATPTVTPTASWSLAALGDSIPAGTACDCTPYPQLSASDLSLPGAPAVTASNEAVSGYTSDDLRHQLSSATPRSIRSRPRAWWRSRWARTTSRVPARAETTCPATCRRSRISA